MENAPLFDRVCLIGLGLIGSSLGHAIKRGHLAGQIIGHDLDPEVCARAVEIGFVDQAFSNIAEAARDADLIVLCTPVGSFGEVGSQLAPHLKSGAIISDVGSVKSSVYTALADALPSDVHLIPAHPVAGTENSGPDAGFATLFDDRWCILTPTEETPAEQLDKLAAFWTGCGAKVEMMTADHHDLVLAITSHIPHLIAYNIVGTAADLETVTQSEVIKFSAGGFRDFTRIAASNPDMWRDIFLANKDAVLEMLGRFSEDLSSLQRAIRWNDGDALHTLFSRTRSIRREIIEAGQESPEPNFGRSKS